MGDREVMDAGVVIPPVRVPKVVLPDARWRSKCGAMWEDDDDGRNRVDAEAGANDGYEGIVAGCASVGSTV